jgi:hypothetical protein
MKNFIVVDVIAIIVVAAIFVKVFNHQGKLNLPLE